MPRSKPVRFSVSEELFDALEILSFTESMTVAATARKIIALCLTDLGLFDQFGAVTEQMSSNIYHQIRKDWPDILPGSYGKAGLQAGAALLADYGDAP